MRSGSGWSSWTGPWRPAGTRRRPTWCSRSPTRSAPGTRVAGDGTAEVTRTEADADLMCDTTDLASAYLGGIRLAALAAAGRVRELRPGAVRAASLALAGEAEPYCLEVF